MTFITKIYAQVREYLFPGNCVICGTTLLDTDEAVSGLCVDCMSFAAIRDEPRCSWCGRSLISERDRCMDCRKKETTHSFDRLITVYPYTGAYQKLLSAYKFGKSLPLGHFLAEKIMQAYTLFPAGSLTAPVLVPVPPRPGKIKSTGWDQIEYLAQVLERMYRHNPETALPVYRCLKRLSSQTQKHLSRQQRKTNLVGRILCTKAAPRELILFDDVFTTGSTMDVCSAALKASGAQKVYGICLFHT